jgi:hypothetical protein
VAGLLQSAAKLVKEVVFLLDILVDVPVLFLNHRIKCLSFFELLSYSYSRFSVTHDRYSVKYASDSELLYLSDFGRRSLARDFVYIDDRLLLCFQLPNPVLRINRYVVLIELEERRVRSVLGYIC